MKKNYFFKFLLLAIPVSAFLLISSSGGRTDGRSGSPGDGGNTCAQCHSGGDFDASVEITSDIPVTGYELNKDYTINVNTTSSSNTHGFQLVAETDANVKVGAFTAGNGSRVSGDRITHSSPSSSGDWSFTWRSPATDLGKVTFYTAVNAANGNGSAFDGQDQVVTANSATPSLSIAEANRLEFSSFPNPATDRITLQLPTGTENAKVGFYDAVGRLALTRNISDANNSINVNSLSKGIYLLKVSTADKIGTQRFIKN
ncbi:choice-of-anchor V domain-containing protein [uncultured Polaribacter sp.]|uniref:choice-of-anchor V domain-containing protein n=1 Tax=uncultured Polaribacter sp. TaxID=174711 RepID=UPI00260523B3|nr:choice-of-anchor V domain-containing protein [uncultured Polaribacter sp.]